KTDMYSYFDTRPVFNEVEAVRRAAFFAKETGCKIHFVHLSSAEAVREALRARSEGVDVSIETCPHFLALNRDECHRLGTVAKCSPAIRSKEESDLLWKEFLAGNIDTVGSDHSPCPPHMKDTGGDIFKAWGGISGCQNVLDIMFDEAVQKRGMCPAHFSKILSTNPAERFGLPGKGKIAPGFDADLVLIKPNAPYILKTEDLQYKNKHSPYVGREIGCQIIKTLVRGHTVYERGVGIAGPPTGRLHQGLRI
ncbi:MAG: amidohydrolase family protein, partial [Defluviitaleaceae bacterium]|nr:amidohydrolase family protein [Defluviitaleaceae bacterium]